MDQIKTDMGAGYHLENPAAVSKNIMQVTKFWSALSEEEKDYLQAARIAIDERLEWK